MTSNFEIWGEKIVPSSFEGSAKNLMYRIPEKEKECSKLKWT
jgi:hypothetical protein